MVGNNTPVFFIRDPMKFQHFIRSQKRRADNNLRDHDMQWDFWTLSPESAHQVTWLMGDRGIPRSLAAHERVQLAHLHVDQRRGRAVLGEVPLQDRPGHRVPDPGRGRRDGGVGRRLPPARPVRGDRPRRPPELDAEDADHAVRGGQDLPVQPVRPDQGVAAQRLPADRGRPADPRPQPDRLPHRDGAGRVRAEQPRARHHAEPGQDAAGPRVLLRRRAPRPARRELQADPGEHAPGGGAQLQQGRGDADPQRLGPGVRAELQGRPAGRQRAPPAGRLALGRRDGALRVHAARAGRRLRPARHDGPRGARRRGPGAAGQQRRRSPAGRA